MKGNMGICKCTPSFNTMTEICRYCFMNEIKKNTIKKHKIQLLVKKKDRIINTQTNLHGPTVT